MFKITFSPHYLQVAAANTTYYLTCQTRPQSRKYGASQSQGSDCAAY